MPSYLLSKTVSLSRFKMKYRINKFANVLLKIEDVLIYLWKHALEKFQY